MPHFEKMLYDNAQLLRLYTEAFRATGNDAYAATASDIGTYLLREMQSDEGGFFGFARRGFRRGGGEVLRWTRSEVVEILADDSLAREVALRYFGITTEGNFEHTGANVLAEAQSPEAVAAALGQPVPQVLEALTRAAVSLLSRREKREKPFRDEKILASWNGLVIGALADAGRGLGEPSLLSAAEEAFGYVERVLVSANGRVARLAKGAVVKGPGFLDDHAFLAAAALDLYESTGSERYLASACRLADQTIARFWDEERDTFFFAPSDGELLITRSQDPYDQAIPSGAGVASLALLRLGAIVDESVRGLCATLSREDRAGRHRQPLRLRPHHWGARSPGPRVDRCGHPRRARRPRGQSAAPRGVLGLPAQSQCRVCRPHAKRIDGGRARAHRRQALGERRARGRVRLS